MRDEEIRIRVSARRRLCGGTEYTCSSLSTVKWTAIKYEVKMREIR
jgi:hypothetical protein